MEEVTLLFPTPLYSNNIGVDYKLLPTDVGLGEDGGISIDQQYLPKIESLKETIDKEVEIYLRKYLRLKTTVGLKHQSSWLLVHRKGDFSPQHYHRNSWLSGVYYYRVNPNSGELMLMNTPPYGWTCSSMDPVTEVEEFSNINSHDYQITPKAGDLFLFPSHLVHKSFPNESSDDRICISFNYTLHGTWGNSTQSISI